MVANKYSDWSAVGGFNNLLAYGEFIETDGSRFLPRGQILDGNPYAIYEFGDDEIVEHVSRSHYQGDTARHPYDGETSPEYGGESLDGKYSWSKAPRLAGMAHEVGPLARVMVAYGLGHPDISSLVNGFSARTGIAPEAMFSVLGRTVARGLESISLANANLRWLDQLESNLASGVNDIFTGYNRPASARGYALGEAPRGALGHWLESSGGKLDNYQLVVPSTWNFGPRDAAGNAGPVEQSLVGVPVADADRPVEVVRAVHSFDPCIACGVHLIEPETGKQSLAKIL
jgi:[NiFe] hydrogenase large subunit